MRAVVVVECLIMGGRGEGTGAVDGGEETKERIQGRRNTNLQECQQFGRESQLRLPMHTLKCKKRKKRKEKTSIPFQKK